MPYCQLAIDYIVKKDRGTVRPQVLHVLQFYPDTRDDDKLLVDILAKVFYGGDYSKLPPIESIVRRRREIQNRDGLFLPSKDVQGRRKAVSEMNKRMFI